MFLFVLDESQSFPYAHTYVHISSIEINETVPQLDTLLHTAERNAVIKM
jgi:hypothetical protein